MSRGLLGLEIADRLVRFVYLEKDKNDYRVLKAGKSPSKVDLSVSGSLSKTIKEILEDKDVKPNRIFLTISRKDAVVYQAVLPKMSASDLENVVSGEIEKIPVFFNRNFDYIFKNFPSKTNKDKSKVVYAAIPSKLLNTFLEETKSTGLFCRDVEITPLNLYGVLPLSKRPKAKDALLMVHEHQTYFSIYENNECQFFYKSSLGLEHLSKVNNDITREHILLNWIAELKRALKSYLVENKQSNIDLVWLVWDKEVLPDLDQRLASALEVDVEVLYTKKLQGITTTEEYQLNPIYSLALTPIYYHINKLKAKFPFDHFFRSFHVQKYLAKAALVSVAFLFLVVSVFGLLIQNFNQRINVVVGQTETLKSEIELREKEAKNLFEKHQEYMEARQRLLDQATYVQKLNRISWAQVFSVVSQELPPDLALTSFKFSESGRAEIKGDSFDMEAIANLMRRIDESAILEKGKFDFLTEKEFEKIKYYDFGILAKLQDLREKTDDNQND